MRYAPAGRGPVREPLQAGAADRGARGGGNMGRFCGEVLVALGHVERDIPRGLHGALPAQTWLSYARDLDVAKSRCELSIRENNYLAAM